MSTKPVGLHLVADDRDELRAGADVALHPRAAQVEPAVADADRLVDALLVELERERRRAREDLELLRLDLDLAGRHRRVDGLRRAPDDRPARADDELVAQRVRGLGRLRARSRGSRRPARGPPRRGRRRRRGRRGRGAWRPSRRRPRSAPRPPRAASCRAGPANCSWAERIEEVVRRHRLLDALRRSRQPSAPAITTARAPVRPAWVIWPLKERPA